MIEALRQSEERLRIMIEAVRDYAIFMLDPHGCIATWNKGGERLKGYKAAEIVGKHFSLFYTEEDRRRGHPQEELDYALAHGSYAEEGWRVRKDGTRFWASIVITALRNDRGELYGFGKVTRDLTERKRAEDDARRLAEAEAAREMAHKLQRAATAFASAMTSEAVASAVFEHVLTSLGADGGSIAICVPGTDQLRLAWSHGYTEEALRDYQLFPISAPLPHSDAVRERRALFFESKEEFNRAYPHLVAMNGLEGVISAPLVVRGQCIGVLGATYRTRRPLAPAERTMALAFADQCALALDRALLFEKETEAKRRAKFLAEATSLFAGSLQYDVVLRDLARLAVPTLGDWCAIEMVDGESTKLVAVAHADPAKVAFAWERREKLAREPDRKTAVLEAIRTGKPALYADIPDEMLAAAARSDEELQLYRHLGLRSAMVVPLIARDAPIGAMTLVWAESERRYSEADLDFVLDLCSRAALAVENARLYQELEKAVRVRDDFMSIAGHEVRTPLAAVQLNLQTIARAVDKDPVLSTHDRLRQRVHKAVANSERLERLVTEVLDVSRITAGQLKLELEQLDLTALVESVVATLSDQAARAGTEFRVRTSGPLVGSWDRVRLEQVISNLLTNALKYAPGKPIEIETAREADIARIRVRDYGIGIEPENQRRIFERFERAVSDRHYGGLGLGLWIARQVVEASGGTIAVQSTPGESSTFTVELPMTVG
jgi:PAS domain S-box-containing protein